MAAESKGNGEETAKQPYLKETGSSKGEVEDDVSIDPDEVIPSEVLEHVAPEHRKMVSSMLLMGTSAASRSSPLAKKINSDHIHKILDNSDKEDQREFFASLVSECTKVIGILAILGLVSIVFIYAARTKDKELSEKVFIGAVSAIGGAGLGYGVAKGGK